MLVEQLHEALDGFSAAVEPLVGPAWREVPAFTLFFGAIFLVALALWRYAAGLERSKAAVLASCCMSSVHGLLSALGETLLDVGRRQGRTAPNSGCLQGLDAIWGSPAERYATSCMPLLRLPCRGVRAAAAVAWVQAGHAQHTPAGGLYTCFAAAHGHTSAARHCWASLAFIGAMQRVPGAWRSTPPAVESLSSIDTEVTVINFR